MNQPDLFEPFHERVKAISSGWLSSSALLSAILYLCGYLSVRFHLTTLGVATDLSVVDERYVFGGAKFLVYLLASVSNVICLALVFLAVAAMLWRLLRAVCGSRMSERIGALPKKFVAWIADPTRVTVVGIAFSVSMIQIVMRQCFRFGNILVLPALPGVPSEKLPWLTTLVGSGQENIDRYFLGLVTGCVVSIGLFGLSSSKSDGRVVSGALRLLFGFCVVTQLLLLPVNHGVLVVDKWLPKLDAVDGDKVPVATQEAWLVWEGKETNTVLIRCRVAEKPVKSLVVIPRGDMKKISVSGYSHVWREFF